MNRFVPYGEFEGFLSSPIHGKHPLVILCHAWRGRDEFICQKAESLAKLGYAAFALDVYGKGILGKSKEENAALKKPFLEDRNLLLQRLLAGYKVAIALPEVDPSRIVVVGFGFGGLCALDLARAGVPLQGAVSIYGHFDEPPNPKPIRAKILLIHGAIDPIVPVGDLHAFEKKLENAGVSCRSLILENTMHAFAAPGVTDPEAGLLYNQASSEKAWLAVEEFLKNILKVI